MRMSSGGILSSVAGEEFFSPPDAGVARSRTLSRSWVRIPSLGVKCKRVVIGCRNLERVYTYTDSKDFTFSPRAAAS